MLRASSQCGFSPVLVPWLKLHIGLDLVMCDKASYLLGLSPFYFSAPSVEVDLLGVFIL